MRNAHIIIELLLAALLGGCMGDARVELAAAGTINELVGQVAVAVDEYHRDLMAGDDRTEAQVIAAFVDRVRTDPAAEEAVAGHVEAFTSALQRLRQDRETALVRRHVTMDNLASMREVAASLEKLAVESMTLSDEARRYIQALVQRAGSAGILSKFAARAPGP